MEQLYSIKTLHEVLILNTFLIASSVKKYKMFSVTWVWDKVIQQLKQVLFGE